MKTNVKRISDIREKEVVAFIDTDTLLTRIDNKVVIVTKTSIEYMNTKEVRANYKVEPVPNRVLHEMLSKINTKTFDFIAFDMLNTLKRDIVPEEMSNEEMLNYLVKY